jgi:hypothetical protein
LGALAAAEHLAALPRPEETPLNKKKVVIVTLGGIRRRESFCVEGTANIPHLFRDLLPRALFYPYALNEGVTAHVNTISSILTGAWQQLDDWGKQPPRQPTLFWYLQRQGGLSPIDTWVVTSNKAVTRNVAPEANVILSKQLMVEAVERIILGQSRRHLLTRENVHAEMKAILLAESERIGWSVPSMNPRVLDALLAGLTEFFQGPEGLTGGDELTFVMAREVLRRLAPACMVINFSGVEVAHSGTYSMHLAGIRNEDQLCYKLWRFLEEDPNYAGRTTLVILPEFGRDPDGSTTNGFFNHRTDTKECRLSWMMVLGAGVREPRVEERLVRQIDIVPTVGALFGVHTKRAEGRRLDELAL